MRTLLLAAIALPLLTSSIARADDTAEDPARFVDPEEWDAQITVSCTGSSTKSDMAISSTFTPDNHASGTAHLTTLTAVPWAHIRALQGDFKGNFTIKEKDIQVAGGKVTTTIENKGSGNGGAKVHVSLSFTYDGYELKIEDSDIPTSTKVTVSPPGAVTTSSGSEPLDFASDKNAYPPHGMELSGSATVTDLEGCTAPGTPTQLNSVPKTITWKLTPVKKMEAKPKLVSAFHRGEQAQLDGSDSTGHPTKFEWELTPQPCPKIPAWRATGGIKAQSDATFGGQTAEGGKQHEGKTWAVKLLCDTKVTLTVSDDAGNSDKASITVSPTARDGFATTMEKDDAPASMDEPFANGAQSCGKNRCSEDPDSHHWIHSSASDRSDNVAFDQIQDAESPFDGWGYVTSVDLKIKRTPFVNERLLPGGTVQQENPAQAAKLVSQIQDHEKAHSDIVRNALADVDPGPDVEQLCEKQPDSLLKDAEAVIQKRDESLNGASSEDAVSAKLSNWRGKHVVLQIPDADGVGRCTWDSGDLSLLGEGRTAKLTGCHVPKAAAQGR